MNESIRISLETDIITEDILNYIDECKLRAQNDNEYWLAFESELASGNINMKQEEVKEEVKEEDEQKDMVDMMNILMYQAKSIENISNVINTVIDSLEDIKSSCSILKNIKPLYEGQRMDNHMDNSMGDRMDNRNRMDPEVESDFYDEYDIDSNDNDNIDDEYIEVEIN